MTICKVFLFRHLLIYGRLSTQQVSSSAPCWPTLYIILEQLVVEMQNIFPYLFNINTIYKYVQSLETKVI